MTNNFRKVRGDRLKSLRKTYDYSLQDVADYCGVKQYQTISKWESENSIPSLDNLFMLCELFDCELGYLIGEIDCKTHIATDIQEKTGLPEKAVNALIKPVDGFNQARFALEMLLMEDDTTTLGQIGDYLAVNNRHRIDYNHGELRLSSLFMIQVQDSLSRLREIAQKLLEDS